MTYLCCWGYNFLTLLLTVLTMSCLWQLDLRIIYVCFNCISCLLLKQCLSTLLSGILLLHLQIVFHPFLTVHLLSVTIHYKSFTVPYANMSDRPYLTCECHVYILPLLFSSYCNLSFFFYGFCFGFMLIKTFLNSLFPPDLDLKLDMSAIVDWLLFYFCALSWYFLCLAEHHHPTPIHTNRQAIITTTRNTHLINIDPSVKI